MRPTLLIVDDHPVFRGMAREILESDGFDVVGEAPDGGTALNAERTLRPDVVLVDVRLPDTDGFAVAQHMSAHGDAPAVVVTSSSDDPRYPGRARSSGARGFLAKHDLCGRALSSMLV